MIKINRKSAFTLAEMLIVLGILGVLMAVAVTIMKPQDASRKALISTALNSLDRAMYNAHTTFSGESNQHPFDETSEGTAKLLCDILAEQLNVTENHCSTATAMPTSSDDTLFKVGQRENYLQFITSTGLHVFISNRIGAAEEGSEDDNHFFYLLYVDINGTRGHNSSIYNPGARNKYPDIYTFAAIPLGRVIPLGVMENDEKLLTAKMNMIKNAGEIDTPYPSATYSKAKGQAWGFYSSKKKYNGNPIEVNLINQLPSSDMLEEPYAYNDYIRSEIIEQNANPNFLQNLKFPASLSNDEDFKCDIDDNDEFYDGSCSIQIDTYSY